MKFTKEQTAFFKTEFDVVVEADVDVAMPLDVWVKLKDDTFEIEVDELMAAGDGNPLTPRGDVAVSICDMMYSS